MSDAFTFVVIGDIHVSLEDPRFAPGGGDEVIYDNGDGRRERAACTPADFAALLSDVVAEAPDAAFIISVGDVTDTGSDAEFHAYLTAVAATPMPVHTIPGNHDHIAVDTQNLPAILAGERQTPFERHVGDRWGFFDHGGVRFVWIDWTTWHLGLDRERQDRWLQEHLEATPSDMPVVLLSHNQMDAAFFAALPHPVVASFSGHWHTTRVARCGGAVHVNTGTSVFGGLDYSPAHYRVCTWTGSFIEHRVVVYGESNVRTATMAPAPRHQTGPALWTHALSGAGSRASPILAGDLVVCASRDEARPGGFVEAVDADSGERAWSAVLDTAVKVSPLLVDDAVIASSVGGEVVCLEAASGAERWRVQLHDDPLHLWIHLDPISDGERVFIGDTGWLAALHVSDGSVAWISEDLGSRENFACHAHPALVNGNLLVAFAAQIPDLWAVRASNGEIVWPQGIAAASVYGRPDTAVHLTRSLVAGIAVDPDGQDVYVVRLGSQIDRLRAASGEAVWTASFRGWFNPATPLVTDEQVIACEGMGTVWSWSRTDGSLCWRTSITDDAPLRLGPYRSRGGALLATPTATPDGLLVPTGDGRIVMLDCDDGSVAAETHVGPPIIARVATRDGLAFAFAVDGVLRALPLEILTRR